MRKYKLPIIVDPIGAFSHYRCPPNLDQTSYDLSSSSDWIKFKLANFI